MNEGTGKEILLHGYLQFKDFFTYNLFHSRKRFILIPLYVFFAVILLFSLIGSFDMITVIISSVALNALLLIALYYNIQRISKRAFQSDTLLKYEQHLGVNEQGIRFWTDRTNTLFLWNDIISAHKYRNVMMLYISTTKAIVVPDSYFQSKEQLENVKNTIQKYLKHKSHLK